MKSVGELSDIGTVEWIGWLSLLLPLTPIIVLLSFALIAWFQTGHFPSHGNPDPKSIGIGAISGYVLIITLLSHYVLLFSGVFAVVFLLIAGLQRKTVLRNLVIVVFANAFYFWYAAKDPLGLLNWIGD